MQIRKTYLNLKPDLLFNELKDFGLKQGTTLGENRLETFALSTDSTGFISRGTLSFLNGSGKQCFRAHLVGVAAGETKLMIDTDDSVFPPEKTKLFMDDIDFIFASYESKPQ
jgi:hypothetical protein